MALPDSSTLDKDGNPTRFYAFTRVGTGYSRDEMEMLRDALQPHLEEYDSQKQYDFLNGFVVAMMTVV